MINYLTSILNDLPNVPSSIYLKKICSNHHIKPYEIILNSLHSSLLSESKINFEWVGSLKIEH